MKKIINGKLYDTEKAKEVGSWSNGGSWRDFSHVEETLYRKKTGEFFLHGAGGPQTKYAESCGQNQWSGGELITPLTYESAQEWAEEHLDADEYQAIFGEVSEDDGTKTTITFSVSAATAATIRRRADAAGMSLSAWLEQLVNDN